MKFTKNHLEIVRKSLALIESGDETFACLAFRRASDGLGLGYYNADAEALVKYLCDDFGILYIERFVGDVLSYDSDALECTLRRQRGIAFCRGESQRALEREARAMRIEYLTNLIKLIENQLENEVIK